MLSVAVARTSASTSFSEDHAALADEIARIAAQLDAGTYRLLALLA
jgi:hypothetical protein